MNPGAGVRTKSETVAIVHLRGICQKYAARFLRMGAYGSARVREVRIWGREVGGRYAFGGSRSPSVAFGRG